MKPLYESRLENLKSQEAVLKAKADSGNKEAKQMLKNVQSSISDVSTKVNNNEFSKEELYQEYNSQVIKDFASLYDKNIITKKDVQSYLFDEQKFDTEKKQWALTYDQKEREIALKKKEVDLQKSIANGTFTDYAAKVEDKEESEYQIANKEKGDLFNQITSQIGANDATFASMNTKQKAEYIANLDLDDPSKIKAKNISPELRNAIIKYKKINNTMLDFYSDALKNAQPTIIGSFGDMQNSYFNDKDSELALDKVENYLPITAKVIKDAKKKGKQLTWGEIPEDYRYAIQVEFLSQHRREGGLSDDQAKVYATNEYIMKNKIKNKNIVNSLNKTNTDRGEEQGYFEEAWTGIKELGKTFGGVASDVGSSFKWGFNAIKEGVDYADKQYDKDMKESFVPTAKNFKGLANVTPLAPLTTVVRSGMFREEENLGNIESRDVLGRQNIGDRFDLYKNSLDISMKDKFGSESPYQVSKKAVSYSTAIKEQKGTAELIKQTIIATNPDAAVPEGENFTIKEKGAGFEVTYQVKTKDGYVTAEPVYLDKLPAQLQGTFQQKQDEWDKSIYNPNFKIPSFNFETPKDSKDSEEILTNLATYGQLDKGIVEALYTSGLLLPVDSYVDNYVNDSVQEKNKQYIDNFRNQVYKTKTEVINGNLYSTIMYNDITTGKSKQTEPIPHKIFNEQVEAIDIQLDLLQKVDSLKQQQLSKLK